MTAFDAKADHGIMICYSSVSKAYIVFNKRTLNFEESMHVVFDESADKTSNKVNEISSRLIAVNLQSDSEDEIEVVKSNTLNSHQNQTISTVSLNSANRIADQPAVQQTSNSQ